MGFLDKDGLRYFWQKIKPKIEEASKTGGVSTGSVIGWTKEEIPEGYDLKKMGYSTEEILTGRTWKDGKPTYIKVFDLGLIGSTSATTSYTVGTNIETLVDHNAKMMSATVSEMLPTDKGGGITAKINIFSKDNVININLTRSGVGYFADRNLVVTAEYTKTTDTGNFKYIEKKSVTPIEEKTGHIYDTTNIDNKAENTYSANTIDGLFVAKTIWSGNTTSDITFDTSLEEGHTYVLETYGFSSSYKQQMPFVYTGRGQQIQFPIVGLDSDANMIFERYRLELYDTGAIISKTGTHTNCNITGIYKIS